jgi:hypothetical protein
MTWQPTPLFGQPYESVEEIELDQTASTVIDGYVNEFDHVPMRPGLISFKDTGTSLPVDGLYWWDEQHCALAVSNSRVWKITDSAGTMTEITGSSALLPSAPVTFATDGTKCAMANGANIVHTDLSTLTTMADVDAPTAVTHVAYLDGYLLANSAGTAKFFFSSPTDMTAWNALDFASADGEPDRVVAMKTGFREVILLGRTSVEFWIDDGVTPFTRLDGSVQSFGCSAPYSLAKVGNTWMWLDHERRLVTMQGRAVQAVSTPYDRVIQHYASVDDAIGYVVSVEGYPLYVLNFPTAGQSLVYNYKTEKWSKWGYWNTTTGSYGRFRGNAYCYARDWNMHLVGDWANGLIYKFDRTAFTDNGNPIRTLVRTGHINYGLDVTKRSNRLRVKMKRGAGNSTVSDPQVTMRRRVNNAAQWETERWASLGQVGQHEQTADWYRNGIYKTVQYEFVHSDDSDFILISAQEDVEALGR